MKSTHIFLAFALLGLISCGKDGGGGSGSKQEERVGRELTPASPGTYYTVLRPVNFQANGFIPYGSATFAVKDDQLEVSLSADDDQAVSHRQTLHLGTRCPSLANDANRDGFIDYNEASRVVGPALMPLDGDLNSQMGGAESYPRGPRLTYVKSASLSNINADLWKSDEDPSDNVIKLSNGKRIGFEGRVVLIHGTSSQGSFPVSLASYRGEPANVSLPVLCGVLRKVD